MGIAAAEPIIAWQAHEGRRVARWKGYDIIACDLCGFRHVLPLPEPEEFEAARRRASIKEDVLNFPPQNGDDHAWLELTYTDRLESIERLLGPRRRRLLDIGSGAGGFLKTAKARGWRVLGIEASRQASAQARKLGIEVAEGFFNADTAAGLGRFDAIHLSNVLESMPDPTNMAILARDLLDGGGVLCINVPNDFSPFQIAGQAAVGADEWWIAPPYHLNYFDFESAAGLLEHIGLTVVERMTSFPMEMFLMMGDDYTKDRDTGRACHKKRKRFDLALEAAGMRETRRGFYRTLANAGLGREAILIAIKP
ncbi:MAG: class I SAM-dependent methyltransferase [Alphaproteobacteria bacterium]|nr:class I SAM-dependent methyltransferase [Alphaproteobacteria bacterium]MDE2109516.1 class I SAM-dependent methyltransferase [Alphaproteobacteria bacterium]MDE2495100.1 class I SAM-dependent methyltransferase [Alphaproteobacteria bacterium]